MTDIDPYIIRKHTLISAICTIFITYPNVMWIPWNLERLNPGEAPGFWAFFAFRIAYLYALFYLQLRYNFVSIGKLGFLRRFGRNFLYTLAGCALFVGLSYGLPLIGVQTGYVGNILLSQFFVVCLLCTFIGYIASLDREQQQKEQEIERLKIENLQSRCNALVNQINPHFFFNSLNGISSLVRRGDEDATLNYVDRLSDIFRYILRSDRSQIVTLGEEMRFVKSFGHVMEVRFGGKLSFDIDIPDSKKTLAIPVLSLLPLLENVISHNRIDSEHIMTVRITIDGHNRLIISNPIYPKLAPSYTNGFEVHIQDLSDNSVKELESVTRTFISELEKRPEIARAHTNFNSNYPQYRVEVDVALCKRNGVSPVELLHTLGAYVGGSYISNINRFSRLYRVMLQASAEDRLNEESLKGIYVRTSAGKMSSISNYIILKRVYGAESLTRFNLFPSIAVNGAPADGYSSGQAIRVIREVAMETLPSGYGYEFGAMYREEAETGNGSLWVFVICIAFIYLILAALYENLLMPFAVILSVPFGLAGSFLLAWVFGLENNIYMQTGVIMLIGLLSKTAILITDYAEEARKEGLDIKTSALLAAGHRLRPIIMTSATMVFGLLPMIFSTGVGSNGSKSLAIGVIGGILSGTVALLYITPAIYSQIRSLVKSVD